MARHWVALRTSPGRRSVRDALRASPASRSRAAWWDGGAATTPNARVALATSNHGPPAVSVTVAPARSAIRSGGGDIPRRHAAGLDERVEASVGDVRERQRGRAHVARDPDRPANGPNPRRHGASAERQRHHEVAEQVLVRRGRRVPVEQGRTVGGRRERLGPHRVVDRAGGGPAIDDQAHRHAEHGDAVGVVDGPVERIHDPGPPVLEPARQPVVLPNGAVTPNRRPPAWTPARGALLTPRPGSRRPETAPGSHRGSAAPRGGPPR